jgi:hypothetical protein
MLLLDNFKPNSLPVVVLLHEHKKFIHEIGMGLMRIIHSAAPLQTKWDTDPPKVGQVDTDLMIRQKSDKFFTDIFLRNLL